MKKIILILVAVFAAVSLVAEEKSEGYVLGFYNMDNMFDPYHDEGKQDTDFTPEGKYRWDESQYQMKVHNMARVIGAMGGEKKQFPVLLGVSEVENLGVLKDIAADGQVADADYAAILFDGPSKSGLDVGLLYNRKAFSVQESRLNGGVLYVLGRLGDDLTAVFVTQYPSERYPNAEQLRSDISAQIYSSARKLQEMNKGIRIIVMGDFECNPDSPCITEGLHVKHQLQTAAEGEFYSPFYEVWRNGYGTVAVKGELMIYDNILLSSNVEVVPMIRNWRAATGEYCYIYGKVFQQPFMAVQEGYDAGMPLRSFTSAGFIGGYSDHFPVLVTIAK